ncbi:MAG: hypothetical protein KDK36_02820 [Leptospiraceae bacterium]|nr:hypothetical protein [Leptospiraceae bacterium]
MKSPFPFYPLEDNLLGKILLDIAEKRGEREFLFQAVNSHKNSSNFFFTPNSKKQVIMNTLPVKLRTLISENKLTQLKKELLYLIDGNEGNNELPSMDIFMEILEWIITGFESLDLKIELIHLLTNGKYKVNEEILLELQNQYEISLKEDFENGK